MNSPNEAMIETTRDERPEWRAPELTSYPAESAETIATPGPEATFTS